MSISGSATMTVVQAVHELFDFQQTLKKSLDETCVQENRMVFIGENREE